jgi:Kelch motif/FG-GAP-like repeat
MPSAAIARSEMGGGTAFGKHYAIGGRTAKSANEEFDPTPAVPVWTTKEPMSIPRGGLGVASWDNKIYAIGGRTGATFGTGQILDTVEVYDPAGGGGMGTWTTLAPLPTAVSDNYATVAFDGKIYVCGGATGPLTPVDLLQVYTITGSDSGTWNSTPLPKMPTPRGAAMAGVIGGKIVVFGGYNGSTNLDVTEIYDPVAKAWSTGPRMIQPASEMAQGVTFNGASIWAIGTGIFGNEGMVVQQLCCQRTTPGDFDGDGLTDASVWNPVNGNWQVRQSATGVVVTRADWGRSSLGDVATPGDYDGDGRTDVAIFRQPEGNWYIVKSSNNQAQVNGWGQSGDVPVPGYYDADEKTDLAVFRPSDGNWYVLKSSGGILLQGWGAPGDKTIRGDFDGDCITDFGVFRPSEGNWYIRLSAGGALAQNWGINSDKPVPGDYDGDCKDDLAVFRPSDGNWYIRNSGGGVTVRNWGLSTDVPVPGDYDGDGRTDMAVFRHAEATWYILRSSATTVFTQFLGTSNDVPVPSAYQQQ